MDNLSLEVSDYDANSRLVEAQQSPDWPGPANEAVLIERHGRGHAGPFLTLRAVIAAPPFELLDGLADQAALLDAHGTILAVNRAWRRAAGPGTICALGAGDSYLEWCKLRGLAGDEAAVALVSAMQDLSGNDDGGIECLDASDQSQRGRLYRVTLRPVLSRGERLAMLVRSDVTELAKLKRQRKKLGRRLLKAQQDERRRVARELHDSTAQELAALQLSLMDLKRSDGAPSDTVFSTIQDSLDRLQREIRSMSYLYHPPVLEKSGLESALRMMCDGFARRTGLKINLTFSTAQSYSTDCEPILYRLAQEALANVHRHACASEVDVMLMTSAGALHLLIQDNGVGFRPSGAGRNVAGVGIAAMRERIAEAGGQFTIHSDKDGTAVVASVPSGSDRNA